MSLDGFVAGPDQSTDNPLGVGGMRLHDWVFPLTVWRAMHGLEGGEVNESTRVVEESLANIGATIMGRNMFGGQPGPWDVASRGTAGGETTRRFITRCSCSRITRANRSRSKAERPSRSSPEASRRRSNRRGGAAGGKDVSLAGGAKAAQQYLAAGLVDEMEINLVPTLLGTGERLFEAHRRRSARLEARTHGRRADGDPSQVRQRLMKR